jgi:pyridoxine 4-dehydrogenase
MCEFLTYSGLFAIERTYRTDNALMADPVRDGIAYVPFFPLAGFTPLQSSSLSDVATHLGARPMQVALA